MSQKAFAGIMAGLEDALEYAQGNRSRARMHRVEVPMVDVKAARTKLGLSQTRFARTLGLPVSTVRKWEQGGRRPDSATRLLLQVIVHEPRAVEKTIAALLRKRVAARATPLRVAPARRAKAA
jgi:putative transcriptional regulator